MKEKITDEDILKVWRWCHDTYLQYGIKISFPANTDPRKTYQWRYAHSISLKFNHWKFDEDTAKTFIKMAVIQAKQKGILKKGLAALHQNNLLDICYRIVTKQNMTRTNDLDALLLDKKWFDKQMNGVLPLNILLNRSSSRSLATITQWYQSHKISDLFISLSKNCLKAVSRLQNTIDADLLPKQTSLYLLRQDFLVDSSNKRFAAQTFGEDFRD
jgi:hypothetical protein